VLPITGCVATFLRFGIVSNPHRNRGLNAHRISARVKKSGARSLELLSSVVTSKRISVREEPMPALTKKENPDPRALQQKRSSNSKFVAVPTSYTKRAAAETART
jgi:hypothetical protein